MVQSGRRKSLLGILALLGGVAALVLTRINPTGISVVPVGPLKLSLPAAVGLGALLVASIAFLAAATSAKTGTGLPMLAVLICGVAVALSFYPGLFDRFTKKTEPKVVPTPAPPVVVQQPGDVSKPKDESGQHHAKTIFDADYPSSTPTPPATKQETATPSYNPPSLPTPAPAPPVQIDNSVAIRAAHTKLESARAAVVQSLESSPDYQTAKANADAADTALKQARVTNDPGSPELIAASQAALDAKSKLQKLIADAMAKDPAAQEASKELQGLQSR
jgi:hypothetical protein